MLSLRKASLLAFGLFVSSISVAGTGCSSAPAGDDTGASEDDVTTSTIVARAEEWSKAKLLYCQSANGARDYDSACPSYCHRTENKEWDAYRSDCSGLISWAWGLPAPGRVTSQFAPYENDISTRINGIDLRPGDALNLIPHSEHIILFVKWVTKGKRATFIEEPGCSVTPDYAHEFDSNVTISGSSVYVAYEGSTFAAIRYKKSTLPDAAARGYLDAASCTAISGWSEDPDSPNTAVTVNLYFDQPLGKSGGSGSMKVMAATKRTDLCTSIGSCNHAYSVPMPIGVKDGKRHTVYAYGHDVQGNAASILTNAPKTFTCAPPAIPAGIKRHVVSEAAMRSWQFDPLLDVAHEPKASVDAIVAGDDLPAAPTVVKSDDGSAAVYVIDGTEKRHVVNTKSLAAWGFAVKTMAAAKLATFADGEDWPEAPFVLQGEGDAAVYVLDKVPPAPPGSEAEGTVSGNGTSTNDDSTDTPNGADSVDDGQTGDTTGGSDPNAATANGDAANGGQSSGCSASGSHGSSGNTGLFVLAGLGAVLALRKRKKD